MNILQIHNFYKIGGGEDSVVNEEYKLLKKKGHTIYKYYKYNSSINNLITKLKLVFSTHYSHESYTELKDYLKNKKIDIVHVHNFFPLITPSIFKLLFDLKIPVVLTIHNYRLIYPNGLLFHRNKIDERSVKGSAYKCIKDKVYRNSYLQTAVVSHFIEYHRKKGTWNKYVEFFICLNNFQKSKLVEGGLPKNKCIIKPNFVEDYQQLQFKKPKLKERYFVYIGRLSEEKGIDILVDEWINRQIPYKLLIIGEGKLYSKLLSKSVSCSNIKLCGKLEKIEAFKYLSNSVALVFPSIWYEGFPVTIVEAFAFGIPVISTNIGSQGEIIKQNYSGLKYNIDNYDQLVENLNKIMNSNELRSYLSLNARKEFLELYNAEINYNRLIEIYNLAINKVRNTK